MNDKDNSVIEHFDKRSVDWSSLYTKSVFKQRLKLFTDSLQNSFQPPAKILDFGCGSGVISCETASLGYKVTGVDAAPGMVKSSIENAEKLGINNVEFSTIDPLGDDLPTDHYDAIICSSVLEYIADDSAVISNLSRTLKKNGKLFISVPNSHSLAGKAEDFLVKLKIRSKGETADVQFANKRYSDSDIDSLFTSNGLIVINKDYFELPVMGKVGEKFSTKKSFGVLTLITATPMT